MTLVFQWTDQPLSCNKHITCHVFVNISFAYVNCGDVTKIVLINSMADFCVALKGFLVQISVCIYFHIISIIRVIIYD